jgi:hypothetical protein
LFTRKSSPTTAAALLASVAMHACTMDMRYEHDIVDHP